MTRKNNPTPEETPHSDIRDKRGDAAESDSCGENDRDRNGLNFPIIGIGASAGGLEALQEFFENIGPSPEAAFVIIQHLSPTHLSYMNELLARHTNIPVTFVKKETKVEPCHIYLIPPKMNMIIQDGTLHLKEIISHGLNLPIDIFFRSLAEDQRENAVAVILSGTGSDGTLGIRAIKDAGGVTMVQDDVSAKFDGMPKSSISTGMVDLIRTPAILAKELAGYICHPLFAHHGFAADQIQKDRHLYDRIIAILYDITHTDFSMYKHSTILHRLERRVSINHFMSIADYVDYLVITPREVESLYKDILIGVTRFFRDTEVFAALEKTVIPELFQKADSQNGIRVWVPGCSTGEEVYSIAILLKEYMLKNHIVCNVKIFATDLDQTALDYAGIGFFPGNIASDVPLNYLAKFFSQHGNGYQIDNGIRRMAIFARHNVIKDPPFFNMDMVSCRNLLIYINQEAQQKAIGGFHSGLASKGFLLLGSSETLGALSEGFDTINPKAKIFRKRDTYKSDFLAKPSEMGPLHLTILQAQQQNDSLVKRNSRQLLSIMEEVDNAFLPPSVVIDANFDIIYTVNAGKILQVPSGKISTGLLNMLPKEAGVIVSSLIRRAGKTDEIVSLDADFHGKEMKIHCKRITPQSDNAVYYYISFTEVVRKSRPASVSSADGSGMSVHYQERIDELEREILQKKESLQAAVEGLETSNEELQASNEELVASNEELQSSNEELQSVNEELYTVNEEHVRKIAEVTQLNADYDNLLSNTQIGTLFLDSELVIRKISQVACDITNIRQSDVGRPLCHLSLKTLYRNFLKDVEQVNATKKRKERELLHEGKFYFMRIVPYLVEREITKGIIITFVDLTESRLSAVTHRKKAGSAQTKTKKADKTDKTDKTDREKKE